MTDIIFLIASIGSKEKNVFMRWVKEDSIPTNEIQFPEDDHLHPESNYVWLSLFDHIDVQLTEMYHKQHSTFRNDLYLEFVKHNFDSEDISKNMPIPLLLKQKFNNKPIPYFNDLLKNCKYSKLLLLTLLKPIMNKRFHQLNFDCLQYDEIVTLSDYKLSNIIQYYDITQLTEKECESINKYLPKLKYKYIWKHPKNHYIYVNRLNDKVTPATVEVMMRNQYQTIQSDDEVLLNIFERNNNDIKDLKHLREIFEKMIFHHFKPDTELERIIIQYCNRFYELHGHSCCQYRKIKKIVKNAFKYQLFNQGHKCVVYTKINPSMKNKKVSY